MDTTLDNMLLKRAWQTAFELRLCPDGDTLFVETPDENLERHLQICHVCRGKREMPLAQRTAWEELQRRFAGAVQEPARPDVVAGQVWSLKQNLAGWGKDSYFYKPPMVLLLEKIEGSRGFKAVQLYGDRLLMGEGDVWLDNDQFGFAQGWNCYSLHEEALDGCWGAVADMVLKRVREVAALKHAPVEEDSILYFFRRMEINVGAQVALPSVAVLVEEWESTEKEAIELIPGLKLAMSGAKDFVLDIASGTLELLRGTFKPAMVLRGGTTKSSAAKLSDEQKKLIQENCPVIPIEVIVVDDTLTVTLKWLQGRPAERLNIHLFLNGVEMLGVESIYENKGKVKISCKNDLIGSSVQMLARKTIFRIERETILLQIET